MRQRVDDRTTHRSRGRDCHALAALSCLACHIGVLGLTVTIVALLAPLVLAPTCVAATAATDSLVVGEIRLESEDVFTQAEVAEATGVNATLRRAMNALHIQTREWVVRRELLFAPGDPFSPERLAETERNLRRLGVLADVTVAPVDTTDDGRVDVRVAYRDSWTLATGVSFAVASDGTLRGNISLTERNFLGQGVVVQGLVGRDTDATYGRLYFRQNRFLSSAFALEVNLEERSFGYDRWARVGYPFRSDDQAWSAQAQAWTDEKENRWYLSHAELAGMDPREEASLYALLPRQSYGFEVQAARRLSGVTADRIWRAGIGVVHDLRDYDLGAGRFQLSTDDVADLGYLDDPGTPMARAEGTGTWPYLRLTSLGRSWGEGRFLLNYGSREDVPLDLSLDLQTGPALPDRGWQTAANLTDWSRVGPAFTYVQIYGDAVIGGVDPQPALVGALGGFVLRHDDTDRPRLTRVVAEVARGWHRTGDRVLLLGFDRGLRTLGLDGMAGDRLVRWNVEHGKPLPLVLLGIFQTGWGAFYDGGLARFDDEDRDLGDARHELGVGLRFGSLRSSTADLARLDLSWDLDGGGPVITTVARGFF